MKTRMNCNGLQIVGLSAILSIFLSADQAHGAFVGPYSLTPPVAGSYVNPAPGTLFGGWSVTTALGDPGTGYWNVDISAAPITLTLQVIDFTLPGAISSQMTFATTIIETGALSFDFTARYGFGTLTLEFLHNGVPVATNPSSGSFGMFVAPGDTFGFRLSATRVLDPDIVSQVAVDVTNFVPEPSPAVLILGAGLVLLRRRR